MAQDNPFADLIPAQPQQAPGVIYGRPRQPDPVEIERLALSQAGNARADRAEQRAQEAQRVDLQRDAVQLERDRLALERERSGAASNPRAQQLQQQQAARLGGLRALGQQLDRVEQLYRQNFQNQGLATPLEYIPWLPANEQFNSAGAGLGDQALAAFRVPGVGAQSDRELAAFVAANQPRAGDTDAAIEEKMMNLRRRLNAQLEALGQSVERPAGNGDMAAREQTLTLSNVADFASGLSGGRYDINADGTLSYNAQPVQVSDEIANSDEYRAAYERKFGEAPPVQVSVEGGEPAVSAPGDLAVQRGQGGFGEGLDAFARGVADTATLGGADELSAGVRTALTGGSFAQNLQRERAVDAYDQQNNFGARLTGQVAGGFALPVGNTSSVANLARTGAMYGGAYGFGSANGDLGDRVGGAVVGAGAGAATAAGLGALGNALANRGAGGPPGGGGNAAGRELMAAAQRQGIDVLPADVGGPMTRRFTGAVVQAPFASGPIVRAAERMQDQAGARLGQIAAQEGAPVRQEALGEMARGAAQGYIDRTGSAARRGYDEARQMAQGAVLRGERAVANIDEQLAELSATANTDAPLITGLGRLRSDLAAEGELRDLSIDAIRRLRTSTRAEAMSEGLRGTDYQRRAGQVLDALSEDIASQLPADAAAAFRRQDAAYRERLNTIDEVMETVIGPRGDRSAEAVSTRLIQMSRGDSARLRSFLNAVNPEEAGIIRGSLIQEMGRSTSGQQNAAGDAFSLQTFLSNWDRMPERTRGLLFRGDSRQAIEDLARVAEGARASRQYANTSNTAGALNAGRTISEVGRLASTASALGSLGSSIIIENLTGRLLASQRFAQWLARAPRDPARRSQWVRRLGPLASREPAIANDILPLRQALEQSVSQAAAGQQEQNRR